MKATASGVRRRRLLKAAAVTGGFASVSGPGTIRAAPKRPTPQVEDVSKLQRVAVESEHRPRTLAELQSVLGGGSGPVSIGGGRYSMGGQIVAPGSLHLDMRGYDQVVAYEPARRVIRVQAGMSWRGLQDHIDPHDQSVKIMQSYSNFTVGGSVSVNCHGRYVGRGALVHSVRALQLVLPSGNVVEASRTQNAELFRAAVGGYGAVGVISEVELDLEDNARLERVIQAVPLAEYPEWFRREVLGRPDAVLHNADLVPPDFDRPLAVSWLRTDKPLTEPRRLVPRGLRYAREKNLIWAVTELPGGGRIRELAQRTVYEKPAVVWRNFEASLDAASLEPRTRAFSTYLLQEYFIPVAQFLPFVTEMGAILRRADTGALNVSIRHAPADTTSLMSWSPSEVFCFVLYHKQGATAEADRSAQVWTRQLVDAALKRGGRYYLPYRLHATAKQFASAYPQAGELLRIKRQVDPQLRLRNLLWDRYLLG